jgi:hypothetical protein
MIGIGILLLFLRVIRVILTAEVAIALYKLMEAWKGKRFAIQISFLGINAGGSQVYKDEVVIGAIVEER